MHRPMLFLCLLAALFVVCAGDRHLLQGGGLFNCGGVTQLDGKCCQMCWCIGENSDKKQLAADAIQKMCRDQCGKCVDESKKCKNSGDALPKICSEGLQFSSAVKSLVDKCLEMYRKDQNSIKQAKGC